jgi:uncharacterized membrane protein (DUF2068 family)
MKSKPKGLGWIIALLCFAFAATLAYWIVFYTSGDVQVRNDAVYIAFEKSFPLADAWMALCALLGAIGLWRGRSWGFLFALLAASSSIFLGLMDVTFDLNEGIYAIGGSQTLIEILINLATLLLGPVVIIYVWKNRQLLL